jgi:hypothetical protein
MPVSWKASVPFKTFIAYREEYLNSSNSRARKASRCFNSSTESTERPPDKSHQKVQWATAADKKRRDEAAATLEMQKMLLPNLARGENAMKGLVDEDGGREALKDSPAAEVDLGKWKREMALALYSIWGPA